MDPLHLRDFEDGRSLYYFNPPDGCPDSEKVNEGYRVVQAEMGMTLETAQKKAMEREESLVRRSHYQEVLPCVACCNCVIIRRLEHGVYKNTSYICRILKRMVVRYGTCTNASEGKMGPTVVDYDETKAEIEANKNNLIN